MLQVGDRVVAVDGKRGDPEALKRVVATHTCAGKPADGCKATSAATVTVVRDGREQTFSITPVYNAEIGRPLLGFSYGIRRVFDPVDGVDDAVGTSVDQMWFFTRTTVETIAGIFQAEKRKEISGVVGSYETTRQAIQLSTDRAVFLLAVISLSLGIINLFPFLPLDGGHIFWARGREGARPGDPVQRDGARRLHRLRARHRAVRDRPDERHRAADRRGLRRPVDSRHGGAADDRAGAPVARRAAP